MKPRRAVMPPKDFGADPAETDLCLPCGRANIERSRMLLEKANLRHAVFSANEGLELLVKADMLRCKTIDRATAAGRLAYHAAAGEMERSYKFSRCGTTPGKAADYDRLRISGEGLNGNLEKRGRAAVRKTNHKELGAGRTCPHSRRAERLSACGVYRR